ncbi:MAG: LamG-like jellyroll fold domain-containing protein, partial [Nitrosopumilaceae archaeon]
MRKRRALSTVVGMAFAIIALMTTVTYITYSMNVLNGYNQSVLVKNQQMQDVSKEKFQISNVLVSGSKLNMTVANTGTLPITFTKIWVQNTSATATDWTHSYVPSNSFVVPGGTLSNIGQNIPLSIKSTNSYNIKLVTSRGNAQQVAMNSAGSVPLNIQMMFLPPTVSSGFTSELMMVVINNSTGTLTNITPSSLPSPTYGAGNSGNLVCTAG